MGRRLALLIATYEYEDAGLRRLTAPAHDADLLAVVLRDPRIAGYEVTALVNEPHHRVGAAIGDFYRDRRSDDLTLLYFTGHGLKDDDGRLYLAMKNTRRDSLLFTAIPAEHIDRAMEGCVSRQKVLILDCCYSGAFPAAGIAKGEAAVHTLERFQGRGRTVLTASDATQYSFEGNQPHGEAAQSVFTRHLVAGLRDGTADLDGDGDITLDELYSFVHDRVVEEMPQQRPKKQDNVQGRTVIAQNVNWNLPTYLQNAIRSPIATDRLSALDGLEHLYRIGNEVVRAAVLTQFTRLADDDSRQVSAAAARLVSQLESPPARPESQPAPQPEPAPEPDAAPEPDPAPEPGSEPDVLLKVEPEPVLFVPARSPGLSQGTPEGDRTPATAPEPVLAKAPGWWSTLKGPRWRPASVNVGRWWSRLRRFASGAGGVGVMAFVSAALLAGVSGNAAALVNWVANPGPWWSVPWSALVVSLLALIGAVAAFWTRTRAVLAPGLLIGTATASLGGLIVVGHRLFASAEIGNWIELAGYLTLLVTGVLAGRILRGRGLVAGPAVPRDRLSWVLLGLSLVTAAALIVQLQVVARDRVWSPENLVLDGQVRAYVATIVLAVGVPFWVVATLQRRLGLAVLVGWAGGGVSVALNSARRPDTGFHDGRFIALAALFVLAVAVIWARGVPEQSAPGSASPGASTTQRARRVLVAGLLVVPALTGGAALGAAKYAETHVDARHFMTQMALAPDGDRLYILSQTLLPGQRFPRPGQTAAGAVTVFDAHNGRKLAGSVKVGKRPTGLAVSRDGSFVYVANTDSASVSVISTLENATVGAPIPIKGKPVAVFLSADGSRVFVITTDDSLSTIDTATNRVTGSPIPLAADLGSAAISPDGRRIYLTLPNQGTVSALDTATGKESGEQLPVGDRPGQLALSQDGHRLYVVSTTSDRSTDTLVALDLQAGGKVIGRVPLEGLAVDLAVSPDGRRVYVADLFHGISVIDTQTIASVGEPIPIEGGPLDIVVSPDNSRVYVATNEGGISVLPASDPTHVTELHLDSD